MYTKIQALLTIFCLLFKASMTGQNLVVNGDQESWDNPDTPTAWDLMEDVSQEATFVHEGTYAAAHMSAPSSQKFNQVSTASLAVSNMISAIIFWIMSTMQKRESGPTG
ncbi:MAG: hypothetical protein P8100_00475 [bacterium]